MKKPKLLRNSMRPIRRFFILCILCMSVFLGISQWKRYNRFDRYIKSFTLYYYFIFILLFLFIMLSQVTLDPSTLTYMEKKWKLRNIKKYLWTWLLWKSCQPQIKSYLLPNLVNAYMPHEIRWGKLINSQRKHYRLKKQLYW